MRLQIKYSQLISSAITKPSIGNETVVVFVNCNDNNDHDHRDTPASQRELQHVVRYIDVEDFHKCHVHVDGLETHPCEGS